MTMAQLNTAMFVAVTLYVAVTVMSNSHKNNPGGIGSTPGPGGTWTPDPCQIIPQLPTCPKPAEWPQQSQGVREGFDGNSEAGSARIFRGGTDMSIKPNEVKLVNGEVVPNPSKGVSININPLNKNVASRGAYELTNLPDGLKIVKQGLDPGHYIIVPKEAMTMARFQELLNQIVLSPLK